MAIFPEIGGLLRSPGFFGLELEIQRINPGFHCGKRKALHRVGVLVFRDDPLRWEMLLAVVEPLATWICGLAYMTRSCFTSAAKTV